MLKIYTIYVCNIYDVYVYIVGHTVCDVLIGALSVLLSSVEIALYAAIFAGKIV
jgi:hypothetical protein